MSKSQIKRLAIQLKYTKEIQLKRLADLFEFYLIKAYGYNAQEDVEDPDINICPGCGGEADNGFDRRLPPNPYFCTRCDRDLHQ